MSTHFVQIKTMKNMLTLPEGIDKMKALCLIVHACDMYEFDIITVEFSFI